MKGYGLTAFRGVAPERFDCEVLGVLHGWFAKGDIVLVRLSGPVVDEAGLIAGMSGSPVFVDGKLLGAIAYGWRFTKVPLAGVTPAEDMLRMSELSSEDAAAQRAAARSEARHAFRERSRAAVRALRASGAGEAVSDVRRALWEAVVPASLAPPRRPFSGQALPAAARGLLPAGTEAELQPLPVPIAVSGTASGTASLIQLLGGGAFIPVQAAAVRPAGPAPGVKIEPGIPVGAALITGDLDISGMGTLTWVDGDKVLAFGHPLLGSGTTDLPLVVGDVQAIVPSLMSSFKLASAGPVVGRIVQDREPAIMARLGQRAPTFPCRVRVRGTVDETYRYQIAGYWEMAPMLAAFALTNSSERWEGAGNRCTLTARASLALKGVKRPLVLENVYVSFGTYSPALDLVAYPMEELLLNPYREVEVESLDYELEVRPGFQAAVIESVRASRDQVEPGGEVTIYVRLIEYRGEEKVQAVQLKVPDTALPGSQIEVLVCDASTNRAARSGLDPALYAPRDFDGVVRMLSTVDRNTSLIVRASVTKTGLRYVGEAMPDLPPSAMSIMQQMGEEWRAAPLTTDLEQAVPTPWVLEGSATLTLNVKQREPYRP
jgi:hypothetical protein